MGDFEQNIRKLDFSFIEKEDESGVILTENYLQHLPKNTNPEILFALETAKAKFGADAVYFRHFDDGRGAVPQIYIFDNTNNSLNEDRKKEIHKEVWSGCQVPLYIIIDKNEVKLYDAREKADKDKGNYLFDTIKLTGVILEQFSAKDFDNGLFWEEEKSKKHFKFDKSAYYDLMTGLDKVFQDFQKNSGLDSHVALKLIVQCLLIKYLEERDKTNESGYFAVKYFQNNFECDNFCGVIRKGNLLDLLDHLAKDFNGKIFKWDENDEIDERDSIRKSEVRKLAEYLDGTIQNDQYVLWRLYSFSHLPVELIGSIYERLLTNSKDIVYTPEMLVNLMVDECMPLKSPHNDFKIIDVSCGSGIFLVKAYKRLIQWWRYEKWKETGELVKPSLKILKDILEKSIYGIDIQEDAIRLSVFSLALALLDEVDLTPPQWQELKFPDLSKENIISTDFFKFIAKKPTNNFDLVIGNPPFNPPLDKFGKKQSNGNYFKKLKNDDHYESEIKIPDDNPALHFLVQSMKLLKVNAILCLVQPTAPLLYQKNIEFRTSVFKSYNFLQVIDLTNLKNVIWKDKQVSTCVAFLQNNKPDENEVVHIIANRNYSNVNKNFISFDKYDFHFVNKNDLIFSPFIWKANLMGGGRIAKLIERLSNQMTLGEFIETKKSAGWIKGEGFIENKNGKECDYITNKPYIPSKAMYEDKIDTSKIETCKTTRFHRPTNKLIYTPPHILIRANIGTNKIIAHLSNDYLVFKNKIIGIHAPINQIDELNSLLLYLKNMGSILQFSILVTSSQIKVNRYTVPMTEDFMNIPFPENKDDLKISEVDQIIIDDVLKYNLNGGDKLLSEPAHRPQINDFSDVFCRTLNSVYQIESKAFRLYKALETDKFWALHIVYSNQESEPEFETVKNLNEYIEQIIPTEREEYKSYHTQKIFKVYGKDSILLVKPKQLRYWTRSIALRDADETFADYIQARYN